MKPIAVFYATREGLSEQIAEHIGSGLFKHGLEVDVRNVRYPTNTDLSKYAYVVIAASVHAGHHEPEMVKFVKRHLQELKSVPALFLSISLSQAGVERATANENERARFDSDVHRMLEAFSSETGWYPDRIIPVAGALRYSKYNFFLRFIMRHIAKKAGAETDTSRDYEYTNWVVLDQCVKDIVKQIGGSPKVRIA
jgi:menaquinone-dependent protoporphyrinogen oxidase